MTSSSAEYAGVKSSAATKHALNICYRGEINVPRNKLVPKPPLISRFIDEQTGNLFQKVVQGI